MSKFGVTPKKEEELLYRMEKLGIREVDLEESFIRPGGPGGQKTNKAATAVRLKHVPSGIEVKAQQARSQPLNRFYARRMLCEHLERQILGADAPGEKERLRIRKAKERSARRGRKKQR